MVTVKEPTITINGHPLTDAEALTVRVALGNFDIDLRMNGLGNDPAGINLTKLYRETIQRIHGYI